MEWRRKTNKQTNKQASKTNTKNINITKRKFNKILTTYILAVGPAAGIHQPSMPTDVIQGSGKLGQKIKLKNITKKIITKQNTA